MPSTAEFISRYYDLFAGRPDVYAIRQEWTEKSASGDKRCSAYIPSTYMGKKDTTKQFVAEVSRSIGSSGYTEKAVDAHVRGKQFLGVYLIHEDSTVRAFVLDFDGKNGDPLYEALDQLEILRDEAGLSVYLERSQSGNGYHIWGFLDAPVHARTVRRAIKRFISKTATFDRMFPNQNGVTELRPLGNLIALPLHGPRVKEGNSVFGTGSKLVHDPLGEEYGEQPEERCEFTPFEDQRNFIFGIEKIPASQIEELAESAPELPEEKLVKGRTGQADGNLPGVRKLFDPRFGCEWMRWHQECPEEVTEPEWYALACQLAQMRGGRDMFHEVSALSVRYNPADTDNKFDHAVEQNAPYSCEYIRENLKGPKCECDKRFPGRVYHPYGLGAISIFELMQDAKGDGAIKDAPSGLDEAADWLAEVQRDPTIGMGIPTGIEPLDEHIGFRDSTLNVLAARPSLGKTGLALDIAYRLAASGVPIYFFSLEMSAKQLWLRLLARVAGVDGGKMRKGLLDRDDWRRIAEAREYIKSLPDFHFFVDDTTRDIRRIMDIAWDLQEQHGKGLIIIDYLGLLEWYQGEAEYAGNTRNSKECKLLAKALDCPALVLHQFNRTGDDMGVDAQTFDSWLRSTGQIEQDADVILYLLGERGFGIKERCVVKQKDRDGEAGHRIMLEFNQALSMFGPQGTWFKLQGASVEFSEENAVAGTNDSDLWEGID